MIMDFIPAKNKTSGGFVRQPPRKFLLIVIHWIAGSAAAGIRWFQNPNNTESSAHYVIDVDGKVTQMVLEEEIAWHAGLSEYKDYPTYEKEWKAKSLNPCSIGIELAGPPSRIGRDGWPKPLIESCYALCREIHIRYPDIKIIDHSSICKGKIDVKKGTGHPEDVFPWTELLEKSGVPEA